MDGVKRAPVPFAPLAQTPEEALSLYEDTEHAETAYRTARFRTAYALHLGYWSFLFVFFAVGLMDPTFRPVSICLSPLFLSLVIVRVVIHGWLPMTIHSSRMGCRYVLYSRSVRFAWAPSSARKVKMRKHAACIFTLLGGQCHEDRRVLGRETVVGNAAQRFGAIVRVGGQQDRHHLIARDDVRPRS